MKKLIIVALLFLIAQPAYSQGLRIKLHSGSIFTGNTSLKELPVQTKYGLLKIPVEDIVSIGFGLHYDPGLKETISKAVKGLESSDYKVRVVSEKELVRYGKYALPFLVKESKDSEGNARRKLARGKIIASGCIDQPIYDSIRTSEQEIKGEILLDKMDVYHPDYGGLTLKLSGMEGLRCLGRDGAIVMLTADSIWLDMRINVEQVVTIKAEGHMDHWPATPGQYVSGPNGLPETFGKGGTFKAGLLIGKIGDGVPFPIGESGTIRGQSGNLWLRVIESPWNNKSDGSYKITVKAD